MLEESRKAVRRVVNRAGVVKSGENELMIVLRNVSELGACVRLMGSGQIPDEFRLLIPLEKIDAECAVVWRRGRDCGVQFKEPIVLRDSLGRGQGAQQDADAF